MPTLTQESQEDYELRLEAQAAKLRRQIPINPYARISNRGFVRKPHNSR